MATLAHFGLLSAHLILQKLLIVRRVGTVLRDLVVNLRKAIHAVLRVSISHVKL